MANGLQYVVPRFQRDYAWGTEQWEDLWEDLEATAKNDQHYMGYLVFQSDDEKIFSVIDGQQRITTVSLIIISALYLLEELIKKDIEVSDNTQRLNNFRNSFIGFTDTVSLVTKSKLTLNRNNDDFYRNFICPLQLLPLRGLSQSQKNLAEAVKFFRDKIITVANKDDGASIAEFIEGLLDKLLFTTISVGSDLNAYRVFETLNARGVQLSVPDLLKNYLFSLIDKDKSIDDSELVRLEEQWDFIVKQLGTIDFTKFVTAHWNSYHVSSSRGQLFKKIKSEIIDRESAFLYLKSLSESVGIYAALHNADDELWLLNEYKGAREPVKVLNLFSIKQPFSMLITAHRTLPLDRFCRLLKSLEVISVRYNVVGSRQANTQDRIYNNIAIRLHKGELKNISSVNNALRDVYPSDEDFKEDFRLKSVRTLRSPKKARYLLGEIERTVQVGNALDASMLTIEHILPESPDGSWIKEFGKDYNDYIDRLGNMTLVSKELNRELDRKDFLAKKELLKKEPLGITTKIFEYEKWVGDSVNERQNWLGSYAAQRWKIQFN